MATSNPWFSNFFAYALQTNYVVLYSHCSLATLGVLSHNYLKLEKHWSGFLREFAKSTMRHTFVAWLLMIVGALSAANYTK